MGICRCLSQLRLARRPIAAMAALLQLAQAPWQSKLKATLHQNRSNRGQPLEADGCEHGGRLQQGVSWLEFE